MTRFMRGTLLLLAAVAVGGLLDWGPAGGFTGTVEAKPPVPKGKGKGPKKDKDNLQRAYDALGDVSVRMDAGRGRPGRELTRLFDQAKDLYADAVHAARGDDGFRARELATAAHDAARGLVHALRADAPATPGVNAPPRREEYELDDLLRRTRDRLEDAAALAPRGPGREFLDAARRFYDQARRDGRDDTARALRLARAAEAWTHVGEHLSNADDRGDLDRRRPRPEPPDEGPRRPRRGDRDAPPPPPPPRDR
jgi:hypothetical protein